jgi:hypothetical protein
MRKLRSTILCMVLLLGGQLVSPAPADAATRAGTVAVVGEMVITPGLCYPLTGVWTRQGNLHAPDSPDMPRDGP